jgi:probable HAF family extracellular repeat protein
MEITRIVTGLVALIAGSASAAPTFTVTPIPGTDFGAAEAFSANGWVAGFVHTAGGNRAFRWSGSGPAEVLGTLGGSFSQATGINSTGTLVGSSVDAGGFERAFRYRGNGPMEGLAAGRHRPVRGSRDAVRHPLSALARQRRLVSIRASMPRRSSAMTSSKGKHESATRCASRGSRRELVPFRLRLHDARS